MPETITIELSEGEFLALHEALRRPAVKNAMGINLNGGQAGFLRHALNQIEETERERLIADAKARGEMSREERTYPISARCACGSARGLIDGMCAGCREVIARRR